MTETFKCMFCGNEETYTEEEDISYLKSKLDYVCGDCYMQLCRAVLGGQCDRVVLTRAAQIGGIE